MRSKKAIPGVMAMASVMLAAIVAVVIAATPSAQADGATQPKAAPSYGAMPNAAQDLLVRQTGTGDDAQISVTFEDGSPDAVAHRVIQTSSGQSEATVATFTAGAGPHAYTFENPNSRQRYEFEVVSDLSDGSTASTGTVEFATNSGKPPAPELVKTAAYRTANVVKWQHPEFEDSAAFRNAGSYEVFRQTVNSDGSMTDASRVFSRETRYYHHEQYNANETRGRELGPYFTDQDVEAGATYRYHLKLRGRNGHGFASNATQATALSELESAPTGVTYFRRQQAVDIEWYNDPEFAYSRFEVEGTKWPGREDGGEVTVHTVEADSQDMSFTITLPGPRLGYEFRIRGISDLLGTQNNPNVDPDVPAGQSIPFRGNWTDSTRAERLPRPNPPQKVSVVAAAGGNRVSWSTPDSTPERAEIASWTVYRAASPVSNASNMAAIAREIPVGTASFVDSSPPEDEMMYSIRSMSVNNVNSFPTVPQAAMRMPSAPPRSASAVPDLGEEGYAISWQHPEGGTTPSGYSLSFTHAAPTRQYASMRMRPVTSTNTRTTSPTSAASTG